MKAKPIHGILAVLFAITPPVPLTAETAQTYRVGVFNFFPAIYAADDGTASGFYTDMLAEIERNEGVRFEYVSGSWEEGLSRIREGKLDLLTSVAYTPERAEYMDYGTVPLLTVWGELCVRKGTVNAEDSTVHTVTDLQGKTVAVMKNDFNTQSFKSYIEKFGIRCEYLELPDFRAVLAAVNMGEADAGVVSALVGEALQDEYGLVSSGIAFNPFNIYFTVRKGASPELLKLLDSYLIRWKENPGSVYYSARMKWGRAESHNRVPSWVVNALLALGIAVSAAAVFIVLLRLRVAALTRNYQESRDTLKHILDSTAEGIYRVDPQGLCVFCNASAVTLLGYASETELMGRNIHKLVHCRPGNAGESAESECELDVKGDTRVHTRERTFYRRDGTELPVEVWAWPISDGKRNMGAVVTFYDVTERKAAESERIARITAERANKAKTAFLANMSHELRTPLNAIIVLSNVLGRKLERSIPEEEHSYLQVIERNGKNLLELINGVLDLSRIESGRETVSTAAFDLPQLLREIGDVLAPQAKAKGLEFILDIPEALPKPATDRDKCLHVIMNLGGNAVKFTERGQVRIAARADNDLIAVSVADTGIGIRGDFLPRVFEEFSQADESSSRRKQGTGLGLAIAKRYAVLLGGDITVASKEGLGSTFEFVFPSVYSPSPGCLIPSPPAAHAPASHSPTEEHEARSGMQVQGRNARASSESKERALVLVIEDNEDNRLSVRSLLEDSFDLAEAENGLEGVRMAKQLIPDLILMDLSMPVMDGFAAFEMIRDNPATSGIPILAVSSSAMRGDPESILARGFNGYVSKPLDPDGFPNMIKELLS